MDLIILLHLNLNNSTSLAKSKTIDSELDNVLSIY